MKKIITLAFACLLSLNMFAQQRGDVMEQSDGYVWPTDQKVLNKLSKWQDQKFGVLFHWGLYSVPGMVESWAICDEDWITRDTTQTYQQYKDWYWGLAKKFNPTKFDPTQWASVMKDAGMKYMIFTTKHHDGFCMFDSKYDDFSIANYAFKDSALISQSPTGTHKTIGGMCTQRSADATSTTTSRNGHGAGTATSSLYTTKCARLPTHNAMATWTSYGSTAAGCARKTTKT